MTAHSNIPRLISQLLIIEWICTHPCDKDPLHIRTGIQRNQPLNVYSPLNDKCINFIFLKQFCPISTPTCPETIIFQKLTRLIRMASVSKIALVLLSLSQRINLFISTAIMLSHLPHIFVHVFPTLIQNSKAIPVNGHFQVTLKPAISQHSCKKFKYCQNLRKLLILLCFLEFQRFMWHTALAYLSRFATYLCYPSPRIHFESLEIHTLALLPIGIPKSSDTV